MKMDESPWIDDEITEISCEAERLIGNAGRMLYPSKGMRKTTTIFNANIFNEEAKKIWFGDIEIERDKDPLLRLSRLSGPLYILYEMDGRFLKKVPDKNYIKDKAIVIVSEGKISCDPIFRDRSKIPSNRYCHKKEEKNGL